ncbi:helix-turn-helix domain-containing protein [bacterium AH-315-F03]|nr:helix-turn-helix domain-containing protein [bacterium AH-315-F03]
MVYSEQISTKLPSNTNSNKPFPPSVVGAVQADWLQCRNARDCARRHGISPRTIHNWIKKYHWAQKAEKVDSKAQKVALKRATELRVSLLERVQRINDEILVRLEAAMPSPTFADFREGVKLEDGLTSQGVTKSDEEDENTGFRDLVNRNASLSPEQQLERLRELASRIEDTIECNRIRERMMKNQGVYTG